MSFVDFDKLEGELRENLHQEVPLVLPGTSAPIQITYGCFTNVPLFPANVNTDVVFQILVPYNYTKENDLKLYIHYILTGYFQVSGYYGYGYGYGYSGYAPNPYESITGNIKLRLKVWPINKLSQDVTTMAPITLEYLLIPGNFANKLQNTRDLISYPLLVPKQSIKNSSVIKFQFERLGLDIEDTNSRDLIIPSFEYYFDQET